MNNNKTNNNDDDVDDEKPDATNRNKPAAAKTIDSFEFAMPGKINFFISNRGSIHRIMV